MGIASTRFMTRLVVATIALLAVIPTASWGAQTADTITVLNAEKLSCGSCAAKIKKALQEKEGIASVDVDIDAGKVTVAHDGKAMDAKRVAAVVTETGYPSMVVKTGPKDAVEKETGRAGDGKESTGVGCSCCNKTK